MHGEIFFDFFFSLKSFHWIPFDNIPPKSCSSCSSRSSCSSSFGSWKKQIVGKKQIFETLVHLLYMFWVNLDKEIRWFLLSNFSHTRLLEERKKKIVNILPLILLFLFSTTPFHSYPIILFIIFFLVSNNSFPLVFSCLSSSHETRVLDFFQYHHPSFSSSCFFSFLEFETTTTTSTTNNNNKSQLKCLSVIYLLSRNS